MAQINSPYLDSVQQPLYFILEIPNNITSVDSGFKSLLQKEIYGITNIPYESFSDVAGKLYDVKNYIFLPKLPYSSAKLKFEVSSENQYQQILNISDLIPGTDNPLFTYSMLNEGTTLANDIVTIYDGLTSGLGYGKFSKTVGKEKSTDWEKIKDAKNINGGERFLIGSLGAIVDLGTLMARVFGKGGNLVGETMAGLTTDMAGSKELSYKNYSNSIGKSSGSSEENLQVSNAKGLVNFNAFLTPKLWKGSSNQFPQISMGISYVCEKDTALLIDIVNWFQEISSPLTLLVPVIPLKLSFYNLNGEVSLTKEVTNPKEKISPPNELSGIRPFTYTQQNFGYFNMTQATISDMGIGVANNTDSDMYNKSGIPLPIGVKIQLTLEAFDPFFYQKYTPTATYNGGTGTEK